MDHVPLRGSLPLCRLPERVRFTRKSRRQMETSRWRLRCQLQTNLLKHFQEKLVKNQRQCQALQPLPTAPPRG